MKKEDLILFLPPFLWGWTFVIVKNGVINYDPFSFVFMRFTFTLILMIILIYLFKVKINRDIFIKGVIVGSFLFSAYLFQTIGLKYTSPTNSAFITSISIPITPFFNFLLTKRKLILRTYIAVITVLIGLYLLFGAEFSSINIGDFLTLICAIFWALHISTIGYFSLNDESLSFLFSQIWTVFILSSISILITKRSILPIPYNSLFGAIVTSIFATLIPFYIQIRYQNNKNTIKTAFIFATEPIFANILEFLLIGTVYSLINYIGMFFIFLSSFIAQRD
ncbi:MAG: DMT family transporter [Caldisericia bacterium]|jgi:drug/metabolite transporter (DMT)-like permease|nr:DMT family transporter [Caldisericia bacterium]